MDNPLKDKSYQFAMRIVRLSQFMQKDKKEYILSKFCVAEQLLVLLFVRRNLGRVSQTL